MKNFLLLLSFVVLLKSGNCQQNGTGSNFFDPFLNIFRDFSTPLNNNSTTERKLDIFEIFDCETNNIQTTNDFACSLFNCSNICADQKFCCKPEQCCEDHRIDTRGWTALIILLALVYYCVLPFIGILLCTGLVFIVMKASKQNTNENVVVQPATVYQIPPGQSYGQVPPNPYQTFGENKAPAYPNSPPPQYVQNPGQHPGQFQGQISNNFYQQDAVQNQGLFPEQGVAQYPGQQQQQQQYYPGTPNY